MTMGTGTSTERILFSQPVDIIIKVIVWRVAWVRLSSFVDCEFDLFDILLKTIYYSFCK